MNRTSWKKSIFSLNFKLSQFDLKTLKEQNFRSLASAQWLRLPSWDNIFFFQTFNWKMFNTYISLWSSISESWAKINTEINKQLHFNHGAGCYFNCLVQKAPFHRPFLKADQPKKLLINLYVNILITLVISCQYF